VVLLSDQASLHITQLLDSAGHGDSAAAEQILDLVYVELHRLASRYMSGERPDHTLQTTGLVHEVYLKLFGTETPVKLNNSGHFFAVAAMQMRRILVDHARKGQAGKRQGLKLPLDEACRVYDSQNQDLVALDDALKELAEIDTDAMKVIELRFFGGYTDKETAAILNTNVAKVRRDWEFARAWLYDRLEEH
jgi:RNA polymerase sigma factor (TIGR02999 family)